PAVDAVAPAAAARKSLRRLSRSIAPTFGSRRGARSRTEPLAATSPARVEHPASATGRHAGPEAVPALAHQLAGLIGPLHGFPLCILTDWHPDGLPPDEHERVRKRDAARGMTQPGPTPRDCRRL